MYKRLVILSLFLFALCGKTGENIRFIDSISKIDLPDYSAFFSYIQSGVVSSTHADIRVLTTEDGACFLIKNNDTVPGEMFLATLPAGTEIDFLMKTDTLYSEPDNLTGIIVQNTEDRYDNIYFSFTFKSLIGTVNSNYTMLKKGVDGTLFGQEQMNVADIYQKWIPCRIIISPDSVSFYIKEYKNAIHTYKTAKTLERAYFGFICKNAQILVKQVTSGGKTFDMIKYSEDIFKNDILRYLRNVTPEINGKKQFPPDYYRVNIENETQDALLAVPPGRYVYEGKLPERPIIEYSCGIPKQGKKLSGMEFRVTVFEKDTGDSLVFGHEFHPVNDAQAMKWHHFRQDLGEFAGKKVSVMLQTEPKTTDKKRPVANFNIGFWGDPVIVSGLQ